MQCLYITRWADSALCRALTESGFSLYQMLPRAAAAAMARRSEPVVIYDHADADLAQFRKCMSRRRPDVLVIALLGQDHRDIRAQLLRAGADRCLLKPVSLLEVDALIQAFLRRRGRALVASPPTAPTAAVSTVTLRGRDRRLRCGALELTLSAREFTLLRMLIAAGRGDVSRRALLRALHGGGDEVNPALLDRAISRLRQRIAGFPLAVVNIRQVGYRLEGEVAVD